MAPKNRQLLQRDDRLPPLLAVTLKAQHQQEAGAVQHAVEPLTACQRDDVVDLNIGLPR